MALYPLYHLAVSAARNGSGDYWISRDDILNGRNGIPQAVGAKIVFQLLLISDDLREVSPDQQSFRITDRGAAAVLQFGRTKVEPEH